MISFPRFNYKSIFVEFGLRMYFYGHFVLTGAAFIH